MTHGRPVASLPLTLATARGVVVKTVFRIFALLAMGLAILNVACPPTSEECTNSIVALVVLSMPWSAALTFLASVLIGLISAPALIFHLNYRFNLGAITGIYATLFIVGLLWAGVLANVVLLYRFAFAQVVPPPRPTEMPPEVHQSSAPQE